MTTKVISAPATLPLDWATVKQHLRLDDLGEQDAKEENLVMGIMVPAAVRTAGSVLRRALITTSYETIVRPHELAMAYGYAVLELPWPDHQAVTLVSYQGTALVQGSDYHVNSYPDGTLAQPAALIFNRALFGQGLCRCCWGCDPAFEELPDEVIAVNFISGYGDTPADVPADVRAWLLLRVGALYENREEVSNKLGGIDVLPFVDSLLSNERDFTFA